MADVTRKPNKPSATTGPSAELDEKLRKRLKHREYVKKSYQKKITTVKALKHELDALETQYSSLVLGRSKGESKQPCTSTVVDVCNSQSPRLRQYIELAAIKAQFQRENAELYELNAEFMKAESRVQQLVDAGEQVEASPPPEPQFGFKKLPNAEYAKIIANARDDVLKFANDTAKLSSGSRVFGWTDQRKVAGDELKFALEKSFPSISAVELLARSWAIFSSPERFSKIYSSSLHVTIRHLQHINDDTHLFYRTVEVDGSEVTAKTVYLLARIQIQHGYMVLFRGIDASRIEFQESLSNQVVADFRTISTEVSTMSLVRKEIWVDKYSWVIFHEQGPSSCRFHYGGSTMTNLWLKEVLFVALRWETMAVGPPIMLEL